VRIRHLPAEIIVVGRLPIESDADSRSHSNRIQLMSLGRRIRRVTVASDELMPHHRRTECAVWGLWTI
jgi:hypothetical protein